MAPADLERLLQEIRTSANVTTRTTVVLSTPYENRPPKISAELPGRARSPAGAEPAGSTAG